MGQKPTYDDLERRVRELERAEQERDLAVTALGKKERLFNLLLINTELFFETLINSIPMPIFYKDVAGRYLGFNASFETFFGESKEQLLGKSVFDINPPELAEIYHAKDKELFENGGRQCYESRVQDKGGSIRDVVFNKSIFTDSRGAVKGLIGVVADVTERRRAKRETEVVIFGLRKALEKVKRLSGLLPICAHCKKIRDDKGYWKQIETYIQDHSDVMFSHGMCHDCARELYPDLDLDLGCAD